MTVVSALYNAGLMTSNFDRHGRVYAKLSPDEKRMRDSNEHFLESYHYINKESFVKKIRKDGIKVFLDSGAFTAYTQKVQIDLGRYCDYCHLNQDIILFPSVLDVIDFNDKNKAIKGTYKNQIEMEQRFKAAGTVFEATGASPLPAVHYGEPDEVVKHYADKYNYIALGGLVPISTPQMILWLDHIFERYLCNPDGTPRVKVHGFGITSLPIMRRYPWFSVDSSTWVQWSLNGLVLHPGRGTQINVSNRSSARKVKGQHLDNLVEVQRDVLEAEIIKYGADPERLREYYYSRWSYNCWAFPSYINMHGFAPKFIRSDFTIF